MPTKQHKACHVKRAICQHDAGSAELCGIQDDSDGFCGMCYCPNLSNFTVCFVANTTAMNDSLKLDEPCCDPQINVFRK